MACRPRALTCGRDRHYGDRRLLGSLYSSLSEAQEGRQHDACFVGSARSYCPARHDHRSVAATIVSFAPVAAASGDAPEERSDVAIARIVRLNGVSAVSGAAAAFQSDLMDAFIEAGARVAPLDATNRRLGSITNKDVNAVLAGGVGSRVTDERTLREIRRAGKQLGVATAFLGVAESYNYDQDTGTADARVSVGLIDASTGDVVWVRKVSASAKGGDGSGKRRAAFDAVLQEIVKGLKLGDRGDVGW